MRPTKHMTTAAITVGLGLMWAPMAWSQDAPESTLPEPDAGILTEETAPPTDLITQEEETAPPSDVSTQEEAAVPEQEGLISTQKDDQTLSDDLFRLNVLTYEDEKVGSIAALILDSENRVVGAVLAMGGFLGIGEKRVALPWSRLDVQPSEGVAYVGYTKAELDEAPPFKTQKDLQAEQEMQQTEQEQQM